MRLSRFSLLVVVAAATAVGCGRPSPAEPSSYHARVDENLERDRGEFIAKSNARLAEVDNQIGLLQAKIGAESAYVTEDKRAQWKQQLFDLRQERRQLDAEVKR